MFLLNCCLFKRFLMPVFVIFNYILLDGIGDFFHFEGIVNTLLDNSRFNQAHFSDFVNFDQRGKSSNYEYIKNV